MIPYKIATLLTFETLKWDILSRPTYSLLSVTSRHSSVQGAPGGRMFLGHIQFGTRHFGTYSIRNIVTMGHVILGQARFGTALFQVTMYRQFAWKVGPIANSVLIR